MRNSTGWTSEQTISKLKEWAHEARTVFGNHCVAAIRQTESRLAVDDLCLQLGVSDATFYAWTKKDAHLGVRGLRRFRQLIGPFSSL